MSDKKNLDRFFQEKFKDFESEPHEQIWKNIELALKEEKKERKVIPFWWRLSGIAAAFIIGLFVLNFVFINSNTTRNTIVNKEKKNTDINKDANALDTNLNLDSITTKNNATKTNAIVENTEDKTNDGAKNGIVSTGTSNKGINATDVMGNDKAKEGNAVTSSVKSNNTKQKYALGKSAVTENNATTNRKPLSGFIDDRQNTSIADTKHEATNKINDEVINATSVVNSNTNKVVIQKEAKDKIIKESTPVDATNNRNASAGNVVDTDPNGVLKNEIGNSPKNKLAQNTGNKKEFQKNSTNSPEITDSNTNLNVAEKSRNTKKDKNNSGLSDTDSPNTVKKKNTIIDTNDKNTNSIVTTNISTIEEKKLDSTTVATVSNALEELLKKNEKEKENKNAIKTKSNRWQLTSSVAPIYFSSVTNGSSIDAQFNDNKKTYENNLSVGIGVNYAVSKKIKVRTSINTFTLGYNTNDVVFYAGLNSKNLKNISTSQQAAAMEVRSRSAVEGFLPFENTIQDVNEGIMNQSMSYFEVPLEISYAIVDKKFGVNLIGGISTLFLNDNSVSLISPTMSANLGKANNLNAIHFSTNMGIGFKYKVWKSLEANFEPTFKYQINTFSDDVGGFKPYFIGLYSGLSFKF